MLEGEPPPSLTLQPIDEVRLVDHDFGSFRRANAREFPPAASKNEAKKPEIVQNSHFRSFFDKKLLQRPHLKFDFT